MIAFVLMAAVGLIAAGIFSYMYFEAHQDRLVRLELPISGLAPVFEKRTLLFISDIHRRKISYRLLNQLPAPPDYIVIGGDLTERGVSLFRVRDNLRRLKLLAPTYFVWGNHDWEAGKPQIERLLKDMQITILDNRTEVIEKGGQAINFTGVDDTTYRHDRLDLALQSRRQGVPTLLFSHNPSIKKQLDPSMNLSYVISGHTHGGQINLFGLTLKEKGGVKAHDFGTLIISNGYGTTKLPLRFAARPDALYLVLGAK
ncbi:MAG: metallophosphoesterase [Sporolactobacillus sp.]